VADRRQLVVEVGGKRRLEGGQVENLQDRGSAERIDDLGPREDGGSQCGSRDGCIKVEKRVASLDKLVMYGLGILCMGTAHDLMIYTN
jgi:hypothetical protein